MSHRPRTLTGRIGVPLPPGQAFRLFTPRGEQDWAPGWRPLFPAPAPDDSEPGTVFETEGHGGHSIWLVLDRHPGALIRYARVTPGQHAGTVTVRLFPSGRPGREQHSGERDGGQHSEVEVTYQLTALTGAGERALDVFAGHYPAYLRSWQDAITAALAARPAG
jgi:hypothetical protein